MSSIAGTNDLSQYEIFFTQDYINFNAYKFVFYVKINESAHKLFDSGSISNTIRSTTVFLSFF